MKEIKLTNSDKVVLVDDQDYEFLNQWKWHIDSVGYAARSGSKGAKASIRMHRQIMCPPKGLIVDHKNGISLDNRKENLRVCTRHQNQMNLKVPRFKNKASKYKGVSKEERGNARPWRAYIVFNDKQIWLGGHYTERDAAIAYNAKAIELYGEFARLNEV